MDHIIGKFKAKYAISNRQLAFYLGVTPEEIALWVSPLDNAPSEMKLAVTRMDDLIEHLIDEREFMGENFAYHQVVKQESEMSHRAHAYTLTQNKNLLYDLNKYRYANWLTRLKLLFNPNSLGA